MIDHLSRFTEHLKNALQNASGFAISNHQQKIKAQDFLIGILNEQNSLGATILNKFGCENETTIDYFVKLNQSQNKPKQIKALELSTEAKTILDNCLIIAQKHKHRIIGTEHLLFAILEQKIPAIQKYFKKIKIDPSKINQEIQEIFKTETDFLVIDEIESQTERIRDQKKQLSEFQDSKTFNENESANEQQINDKNVLEAFGKELTNKDTIKTLDPVIGREQEIQRMIEILIRRTKSNPILLGEPGVGKTALVEGLARYIHENKVPKKLYNFKIVNLDLASTLAGTMYRGEFEARLKSIINEVKNNPNIILFIDEIHNIIGSGSTTGSLDTANILKPALARGEIRCIGATTWEEYKKHIQTDSALERRFQPITIKEPTKEETFSILKGLEKKYAKHHQVKYSIKALQSAVNLAEKYLTDRFFPDKAIDLIDEAVSYVITQKKAETKLLERINSLDALLKNIQQKNPQDSSIKNLKKIKKELLEKLKKPPKPTVTEEDILHVVSKLSGVPVNKISLDELNKLKQLDNNFNQNIFGQEKAIQEVSHLLKKAQIGFRNNNRPKASMLFVGPSGTGKTELAKLIAQEIFGNKNKLIKIDMSEFSEQHSISKLLGAPAGYIGYREPNKLTDIVRKQPHCVICFDEIEKAHPNIQHALLQILEDGHITDATGKKISFQHTYIILTSNIGSDKIKTKNIGYTQESSSESQNQTKKELQQYFKPEFLNRLDKIIIFQPLLLNSLRRILEKELQEVCQSLQKHQKINCQISNEALDWLMQRNLSEEEGARAIRHLIEKEIINKITDYIIYQKPKKRVTILPSKQGLQIK